MSCANLECCQCQSRVVSHAKSRAERTLAPWSLLPATPTSCSSFATRAFIIVHCATTRQRDTQSTIHAQYFVDMPPKKAKTAAKAKALAKNSTRTNSIAAPATVVTSRGKEYDTTAAAARPRRATVQTPTVPVRATANSKLTCRSAIMLTYTLLTCGRRDRNYNYSYEEARQTRSRNR